MKRRILMGLLLVLSLPIVLTACNQGVSVSSTNSDILSSNTSTSNDSSSNSTDVILTISQTNLKLAKGYAAKLNAEVSEKIEGVEFEWTTSDSNIATVSTTGRIVGVGIGECIISVKYGSQIANCNVVVEELTITLNLEEATLDFSKTTTLQLSATDSGNINEYSWASSNESVAVVNSEGLVTAKGNGTAEIIVSIGTTSSKCVLTVINFPEGYYVLENGSATDVYNNAGKWYKFGACEGYFNGEYVVANINNEQSREYYLRIWPVLEDIAENDTFTCMSTVTSTKAGWLRIGGQELTYIEANTPTNVLFLNKVNTPNSSLSLALCDSNVNSDFAKGQYTLTCTTPTLVDEGVEGITLSDSTVFMEIGKEKTLEAVVGAGKKVIWETTDENIVSVDNGKLTALKRGEVTITASIENEPEFTASCKVYVGAAEDKITYTYGDGTESMPSQSTTDEHPVGSWYQNGVVGTATMKGGIFEIKTSKEIADNKLAQLRFIFAKNNDTNFYIGSFYMVFTITNETAKDMNYQYRLSSGTDTDKETVASGSSKQVIAKMTTTSDSEYLNIKLRSYGIGTVTISDIYLVPLSE